GVGAVQGVEGGAVSGGVQRLGEKEIVQRLVTRTAGGGSGQRRGSHAQHNNADQRTSAHESPSRQTPVANGYSPFTSRRAEWTRGRSARSRAAPAGHLC